MISASLPEKIKVGEHYIGKGCPTYFIAEIGNNHNGDFYLAKRSIEKAVKAGANAVKFQKRFIDEVFTKEMQNVPQTKDQVLGKTYGEYRRSLELNEEDFKKLKAYASELGVTFFATPFDKKSVDFLEAVGVDVYKIASFDVTNIPLLEYVAQKNKPVILSVGMADINEIDLAVETILKFNNQLILLHCITIYPAPDEKLHLATIPFLSDRYRPVPVGYSGHEKDILPSLAAVAFGAKVIERHFTLDRDLPGPDHATVSIEPQEFKALVDETRRIEKIFGTPKTTVLDDELRAREKHGKSVVAKTFIPAGTEINEQMLSFKSPGYGIKPSMWKSLIGKRVKRDIAEDTVIAAEFIDW